FFVRRHRQDRSPAGEIVEKLARELEPVFRAHKVEQEVRLAEYGATLEKRHRRPNPGVFIESQPDDRQIVLSGAGAQRRETCVSRSKLLLVDEATVAGEKELGILGRTQVPEVENLEGTGLSRRRRSRPVQLWFERAPQHGET